MKHTTIDKTSLLAIVLMSLSASGLLAQDMFYTRTDYTAGDRPGSVFSIDLDGDGDNDLVTGNAFDNVSIVFGNGDGTFQNATIYAIGANLSSVFSIDLDGDGDNDLVIANLQSNNVTILLNLLIDFAIASGDADCSGGIDIDDVVYLILHLLAGGPIPCDPSGDGAPDC